MTSGLTLELAETLRQCRAALETALPEINDPVGQRVIQRRIDSADRVLAKLSEAL
jgi:hypothetical protein